MNSGLLSVFKVDGGERHHVAARHPAEAMEVFQDTIGNDLKHGLVSACVHPVDPDEEIVVTFEVDGPRVPKDSDEGFERRSVEEGIDDLRVAATAERWAEWAAREHDGPELICSSVLP